MRQIIWSPDASLDLHDIGSYIERWSSRRTAARFLGRIRAQVRKLREFPGAWPACEELEAGMRRTVVGEYLIFYTFDNATLRVWRVLHGRREINPEMFKPERR